MQPILLIVDDEKSTRDVLSQALEDDYEVYAAANGKAARAIMESEPVDLLLTDLRLGGESGMDLIDFACGLSKPPTCIMMTAYGSEDTAAEARRHGAYYFVTKPLNLDEVELLLKRAAHTRQLEAQNRELETQLHPDGGLDAMLGDSPQMQAIFNSIRRVAPTTATVLIEGESGTGKELVARAIHRLSGRPSRKFVAVNCAALSPQLMESELFGHERGAFTGAAQRRIGRFEEASGGTIFLDEIGEIDMPTQVKLLRVLSERTIERVGSNVPVAVDVRVVAATNRDLEQMVREGSFRLDLYQRLNVIAIHMPPLRERTGDLVLMANAFVQELSAQNNRAPMSLSRPALDLLLRYRWPGNVRQLRTAIEHGVVMATGDSIKPEDLPDYLRADADGAGADPGGAGRHDLPAEPASAAQPPASSSESATKPHFRLEFLPDLNLQWVERQVILLALERTRGNRTEAARLLGINRRTLQRKMAEAPDLFSTYLKDS
ncbi:MAG TPA: sigma-54 dependent transcriptional regulator [Candidatus Akkermansia intestinigallinarum]|uniref:Sigma-54 dependent transcriptional regulator n=1 Tax=Candidatus Akkermansia intestinigallinarum TaxID=2838431 RepID=A0A9D1VAP5_9BACT|nr:sigma-54 dependent transcriptional regulator [Candidatus Akkermansia intestinigallinarum]